MIEKLPIVYKVLILIGILGYFAVIILLLFNLFKMMFHVNDGVVRRDYLYNRLNVIFFPFLLNDKGKEARVKAIFWGKIFVSIIFLILCIVFIINMIKGNI